MEQRENRSRSAREAPSQAMVVDAATAPVGRRDMAAMVGALAGLGLVATGCASAGDGDGSSEMLARSAQALTGTALRWVDTVLGAQATDPPTPRPGDLASNNSATLGGAILVVAKGCVTAGDGAGGLFYWDASSTELDDGGTIIQPSVAGAGRWKRIFDGAMSIMWFGAKGDGSRGLGTGDHAAVVKALAAASAAGRPLSGGCRTYGVWGGDSSGVSPTVSKNIVLPANIQLQDATFKQLSPAAPGNVRTLTSAGGNNIKLVRVKVDRNGDGNSGDDQFSDAGIWIQGGSGHHFEDVEVWGNDKGTGFVVWQASNFDVVRLHVHDIRYAGAVPNDDRVQGFWFNACSDFRVIAPTVHDLGGPNTTQRSRNPFGGCSNFSLIDAQVWNVDQGIDFTGGNPGDAAASNRNFRVLGGSVRDCYSAGFKFANTAHGGVVIGATTERCDLYGFFACGPAEANFPIKTGNITFVDCVALDTGSVGHWKDPNSPLRPAGFAVEANDFDRTISPLGIRFVNCTALDRQAMPTMKYGFVNEIPAPVDGRYNECINCVSIGHTASPTRGMHRAFCQVKLAAPQLIGSGAWIPVSWDGEDCDEGAMHVDATYISERPYIYARQPGLYEVIVSLEFAFNATGGRGFRLVKNNAPIEGTVVRRPPSTSGGDETRISLTWQVRCAAGDKLSVDAFQQSDSPLYLTTGSRMIVTKIHNTGTEA